MEAAFAASLKRGVHVDPAAPAFVATPMTDDMTTTRAAERGGSVHAVQT